MKIGYSKTYPIIGKEQWEKIWIEDEVTGTEEDARKALYSLKKQVENFHYESNKAAEKQLKEEKEPTRSQEELVIEAIGSMNDIKFLKIYEKHRDKSEAIKNVYDKKLAELTNQK